MRKHGGQEKLALPQPSQKKQNSEGASLLLRDVLKILGLACLYYPFSIGLTFYQKWFIKDFKFPLSVVCCHYLIKFLSVALVRWAWMRWTGEARTTLGWTHSLIRLAPAGVAASVDIGLSNWAFEYITVSLYTMSKSTSIVFILIFAVLLSLEKLNWYLPCIVGLIFLGLFLFTYRATQFDWLGFLLVEVASVCAGVRWGVSQLLMQRSEMGLRNPVDMIFNVQPWMILSILPLAFAFEGAAISVSAKTFEYSDFHIPLKFIGRIIIGGLIALCMELSEYLLLVQTSGLTLNILGILKEMVTLLLAHFINDDRMSAVNVSGLFLCISGIALHTYTKFKKQSQPPPPPQEIDSSALQHLLSASDSES